MGKEPDLSHFVAPPAPEGPPASTSPPGPDLAVPPAVLGIPGYLQEDGGSAGRKPRADEVVGSRAWNVKNGIYDPSKSVVKVNYSHDAMIDLIIANPGVSQGELARVFGYTEGWVSQVMQSDAFKERLAGRKKELVDPTIVASIEERFQAVAMMSLERLKEKLERSASPTVDTILQSAELAAKALGYGAKPTGPQVAVQVQTVVHVPAKAKSSSEWLEGRTTPVPIPQQK